MRLSRMRAATGRSLLLAAAVVLFGAPASSAAYAASQDVAVQIEQVGPLVAGHDASWLVTVTNQGASSTAGLRAVIALPDGVTYGSAASDSWSCSASAMTVTCDYLTDLAAGTSSSATITAAVRAGAPRVLKVPVTVTAVGDASMRVSMEEVSVVTEVLGEGKIAEPATGSVGYPNKDGRCDNNCDLGLVVFWTIAAVVTLVALVVAGLTFFLVRARARRIGARTTARARGR